MADPEAIQKQVEDRPQRPVLDTDEIVFTNKLINLRQEALEARQQREKNWSLYISMSRNEGFWERRRPKYKVDGVINLITPTLERKAALLTDTKPTVNIIPQRGSNLDDSAIILKNVIDGIFAECMFDQKLAEICIMAQIFGVSFINTMWDKMLDFGSGDINVIPMDARSVLVDPHIIRAYRVHRGEFVIIDDIISLDEARDTYPKRADLIKASAEYSTRYQPGTKQSLWSSFYVPFRRAERPSVIPRTIRSEYWIKDRHRKPNGEYFFNGAVRRVTICGGVIVEDGGNPYYDGLFPIDMIDWHFDVDSPYGWGEVELLKSPQRMTNKLLSVYVENAIAMSNGIWVGDNNAMSPKEWAALSNEPGRVVKIKPGSKLQRVPPPALPEYSLNLTRYFQTMMGDMSGMVPPMMGRSTGQISSGVGVEQLQMAANALIRIKARAIEALLARIGQKLISRIFQYYTTDRIISRLGETEEFEQFKFVRTKLIGSRQKEEIARAFADYRFLVVPGSSLAMSKMQKTILDMQLFQLGILDEYELLKSIEYPNAKKIADKAKERRLQMAEMARREAESGQRSSVNRQVSLPGR